jgi:hypothetical protein
MHPTVIPTSVLLEQTRIKPKRVVCCRQTFKIVRSYVLAEKDNRDSNLLQPYYKADTKSLHHIFEMEKNYYFAVIKINLNLNYE